MLGQGVQRSTSCEYAPACMPRREIIFYLSLFLIVAVAGTLPYFYVERHTAPDDVFLGLIGRGVVGTYGYFMWAAQSRDGACLFENRYTPEPTPAVYFNPEWYVYGLAARHPGLDFVRILHLDRVLTLAFFLCAVVFLAKGVIASPGYRIFFVMLVFFGAGLGWTSLPFYWITEGMAGQKPSSLPLDLQGVNVFCYAATKPHFLRAFALAALQYALMMRAVTSPCWKLWLSVGIVAGIHSFLRPFQVPEVFVMLGVAALLSRVTVGVPRRSAFWGPAAAACLQLPALFYHGYLTLTDALGAGDWIPTHLPLIPLVLWAGWPLLALVLFFGWSGLREGWQLPVPERILSAWVTVAWVVDNLFPYYLYGHEASGSAYLVAAPLLATVVILPRLEAFFSPSGSTPLRRGVLFGALLLIGLPSAMYAYANLFRAPLQAERQADYYLERDTEAVLQRLREHVPAGAVILAPERLARLIPLYAPNKVFCAHYMLTRKYGEKKSLYERFVQEAEDFSFKQWLISAYSIEYLIFNEKDLSGVRFRPEKVPWLERVDAQGKTGVYRVRM